MTLMTKVRYGVAALALATIPAIAQASPQVAIEGRTAVANTTNGDTVYQKTVNAKTDDLVQVQIWYHNREDANSGKVANNLKVKINVPSAAGASQTVTGTISADNSNTVTDTANVNLALAKSNLEYVPGSAKWRHNTGTNDAPNWVTQGISDDVVNGGVNLGNENPCFNFESNVTVLMRVKTPSVSITKQVRVLGQSSWVVSNTAQAGDTLEYLITFKNEGNTTINDIDIADNMPPSVTYVPGSTQLRNGAYPNGVKITSDKVVSGGIDVGNYGAGAVGYVWFQAKVDPKLSAGDHDLINVGAVRANGEIVYNTADTKIHVGTSTPTPTPTPTKTVTPTPTVTPSTPVTPTPTTTPQTGAEDAAAGFVGTGALTYAGYFYRKSRKGLIAALRNAIK